MCSLYCIWCAVACFLPLPAAVEVAVFFLWVETTASICLRSAQCFFRSFVSTDFCITHHQTTHKHLLLLAVFLLFPAVSRNIETQVYYCYFIQSFVRTTCSCFLAPLLVVCLYKWLATRLRTWLVSRESFFHTNRDIFLKVRMGSCL